MKKKIVILTGAGFPEGISTASITDKVRNKEVNGIKIKGLNPGEFFYRRLAEFYTQKKGCTDCDLNLVNFETILHLLEELYSFYISKTKGKGVVRPEFKGVKPVIFWVKRKSVSSELIKANNNSKNNLSQFIRLIYGNLIDEVISQIKPYQLTTKNQRLDDFENFIKMYLPDSSWVKRIYTLNYDTLINERFGYFDGFAKDGNLVSDKILKNTDINCHYNLHGSILWETGINLNRVTKIKKIKSVLNNIVSSSYDISREPLISTPIISGYNKSARMKFNPYIQLYYSFQKDIIEADLVLIIGYGFSDTHINNLLELSNSKSIIVTFFKEWANSKDLESRTWDDYVIDFLNNKISPTGGGYPEADGLIKKEWIESTNKNIKIWWKGVGKDFYDKWKEIIK